MAVETVAIELHLEGTWQKAVELTVLDTEAGVAGPTRVAYCDEHIIANIEGLGTCDERAVSERLPLQFEVWANPSWPAFVLDIVPAGAARKWWNRRLAAKGLNEKQLDFMLLRDHTIAPIGHMRVASAAPDRAVPIPFTKEEVCGRAIGFLEHAAELGVSIGGATGAGGDAPKVLLAEDADGNVYPDTALPDDQTVACWLVKWPRGRDTDRDRLILHTEYLYSRVLAELGLDTRPGEWRQIEDGKPSLWLPRFDREVSEGGLRRLAVESFYSLAGVAQAGAVVPHQTFLEALAKSLDRREQSPQLPGLVREYVCRDLLDVVLGNSDNHGRNRAVIRSGDLQMAPIYDLAPMVMDPEGVVRSSRWDEHERGGRIDWLGVCRGLARWIDPDELESAVRDFAERLLALPDLLQDAGLDDEVMAFPRIHLRRLPAAIQEWGLR